jgi:excisionase family DNA binding protein
MNDVMKCLTVDEAAQVWGVCHHTIRKWIKEGRLAGFRVNPRGRFRIPISELPPEIVARRAAKAAGGAP